MYDVERLPKWAQERIESLERERETAVNALNAYIDQQTESPFYFDDLLCTGEDEPQKGPTFKRVYINGTNRMTVCYGGVALEILLRSSHLGISLSWSSAERELHHVAMIPASYQQVTLIAKKNMR